VNARTELYRFDWNGILLEITYEPLWLPAGILGEDVAHLSVRSLYPTDVPLPFAKHGCFSSTILASSVAAAGGPLNYVDVMLTAEDAAPENEGVHIMSKTKSYDLTDERRASMTRHRVLNADPKRGTNQ
jgi:hypothetical protein